ncbi:cytochrome b [Parvularcula sp. ZS-1/3]|uniref:Cytochrome b n=1 Tax=Parvularcula mediterranea TaxID=2732508 RepID=A0A7Y3RP42_9PROT|nr:cytochrome b [Parvularcula mediterranea]NNU17671.1 cytochrome b [Parvularcula mediterranea]
MTNTADSYTRVAKALHWLIALMIIVQIPAGIIMHNLAFSETKFLMYQLHKSFGLIVLGLSLFRLYWRLTHPVPPLPDGMKGWERAAARFTHVAFYVVIIGIPLTGWLMVSASTTGIDTKLFFVIHVPHWPLPVSEALEGFLAETHEYMAKATIALIAVHIGAALKHHFVARDATLTRMLPGGFVKRASAAPEEKEDPA